MALDGFFSILDCSGLFQTVVVGPGPTYGLFSWVLA